MDILDQDEWGNLVKLQAQIENSNFAAIQSQNMAAK